MTDTRDRVFLSHNSHDKPAVEEIQRWLASQTPPVECWLDENDLRAKGTWLSQLEQVIETCQAAILFFGPHGMGDWHEAERELLLDRAVKNRNTFLLIPVLLPGAESKDVPGFAKLHNWVDLSAGLDSPAGRERLLALTRGQAPREASPSDELPDARAPYRGLERFDDEHAGLFFGRDAKIKDLCNRIRNGPFVVVIGGSGSGKSSLVRAGLRTELALLEYPKLRNATRITVLPGSNPIRALAEQVAASVPREPGETPEALADQFEDRFRTRPDGDGLLSTLTSRFPGDQQNVLLVIDQFEELFTYATVASVQNASPRDSTRQFVDLLASIAASHLDRLRIVVTLRADFLDRCLELPRLVELIQDRQLLVGPLSIEALNDVIFKPAEQAGAFFEKGLVARVLAEMEGQEASLPHLQCALEELWNKRRGNWLTHESYDAIGGVAGALQRRAELAYQELNRSQQEIAKEIFLRLVSSDDSVRLTRRRIRLDDLYPLDDAARSESQAVLDQLRAKNARLVVTSPDGMLELTHESLIRGWKTLRDWVEERRVEAVTPRGRAKQQLIALSEAYEREAKTRHLPSILEYWRIRRYVPSRTWTASQRHLMGRAAQWYAMSTVATLAVVLGISAGAWWRIQRGKDMGLIDGAVAYLPAAKAADARVYLEYLRRRPDYAAAQLRAKYDAEVEPSKRLRLAYGLMTVGAVNDSTDDVARFVLDHIKDVPPDDNGLFVEALSRLTDVEKVRRKLHTRSDPKNAADESEIVVRTHCALAAMSLGRMEAAERLQVVDGDPRPRTVFIRDFTQWPIRHQELRAYLSRVQDAEVRSGLCIALGGVDRNWWTEEKQAPLQEQLLRLYQDDPDSGVHSAAGWALNEWQVALPELPRSSAPPRDSTDGGRSWYVNSLGITMIRVPKDPKRKYGISSEESDYPVSEIEVASYWLSVCELTVEQFRALRINERESNQAGADSSRDSNSRLPVSAVTWFDAVNYCNMLSEREGFPRPYYYEISDIQRDPIGSINSAKVKSGMGHGYRLPTVAEWELACRAGTMTQFSFGNEASELRDYGWFNSNSLNRVQPVAKKRPNPWGLHDMHGNVFEWCEDAYKEGSRRVNRGGCWFFSAWNCRSADRNVFSPDVTFDSVGFRLSLVPSRGG